jgi:hypothetical protein
MNSSKLSTFADPALVHAIERRHVVLVEMRGDRLVGQQHELLDEPVGDVAFVRMRASTDSLLVEHELRLLGDRNQIEPAASGAARAAP